MVEVPCQYCGCKFHRYKSALQKNNYCSRACEKSKNDSKVLEMIGKKFGSLSVLSLASNKGVERFLSCLCDCGNFCEVIPRSLISKNSTTCGKCRGKNAIERFDFYTDKNKDDCWLWTGPKNPKGYGQLKINGKMVAAHRFSWELINGPIPNGLFICHKCDVRNCVNPSCMFLGTLQQNQKDMALKNRGANRKWTIEQISDMRKLYKNGLNKTSIIQMFNISRSYLDEILNRTARIHIK